VCLHYHVIFTHKDREGRCKVLTVFRGGFAPTAHYAVGLFGAVHKYFLLFLAFEDGFCRFFRTMSSREGYIHLSSRVAVDESGNCFLEVISPKYGMIKSQIDADDAAKVARFNWTLIFPSKTASDLIYFIADIPREDDPSKTVATRLHIFILGRKPGYIVDHCDPSKTLDNRKSNLRHATGKQNQQNQRRHRDGNIPVQGSELAQCSPQMAGTHHSGS
jgi:hypothetical protein